MRAPLFAAERSIESRRGGLIHFAGLVSANRPALKEVRWHQMAKKQMQTKRRPTWQE